MTANYSTSPSAPARHTSPHWAATSLWHILSPLPDTIFPSLDDSMVRSSERTWAFVPSIGRIGQQTPGTPVGWAGEPGLCHSVMLGSSWLSGDGGEPSAVSISSGPLPEGDDGPLMACRGGTGMRWDERRAVTLSTRVCRVLTLSLRIPTLGLSSSLERQLSDLVC